MTRFVIDSYALLELAASEIEVSPDHELLAPTLIRSQMLSTMYEAVRNGHVTPEAAAERLNRIATMKIRLLGDAVLRRQAWKVAEQLDWESTYDAEFVALTQLQGDAFITLNPDLAKAVEGVVETASLEDLGKP